MKTEIDNHKLMYHPERISEWVEKGDCFPIYAEIGLTNRCNHDCVFCGLDWARGTNTLEYSLLQNILKNMAEHGIKSVCFSGAGEPLLHPDFSLIIKETKELGIDISFSTNAVLFDETKAEEVLPYVSWIRFSVDAATPKTHSKIHGTSENDFQKICENIKTAVEIKRKNNYSVILGVQFLLLEENAHEIIDFIKLFKELGVDNVQIKPYSQNPNSFNTISVDYKKFEDLQEEVEQFSDKDFQVIFRLNRMKIVSGSKDYDICYGLPFFTVINEKGEVQPCIFHYDVPNLSFGNIYEQKFSEIWKGEKRKDIIKQLNERGCGDCKKGCRLDIINKYLHRIKNPELHDNFI